MKNRAEEGEREKQLLLDRFEEMDSPGWKMFYALLFVGAVETDRYKKRQLLMKEKRLSRAVMSPQFVEGSSSSSAAEERKKSSTLEGRSELGGDCSGWGPKKKRTRCTSDENQKESAVLLREERQEPPPRQTMVKRRKILKSALPRPTSLDLWLEPDGQIPEIFKNHIEGLEGTEILLVCEKYLTKSDVNKDLHRLMMPESIIRSPSFLRDEEQKFLQTRHGNRANVSKIRVTLLDPMLKKCELSLRRWEMKKEKSSTVTYVLARGWNEVVARNGLKIGDLVQVWSFRVGTQLHLALILAPAAPLD